VPGSSYASSMKLSEQPIGGTWVYPEVDFDDGRSRVVLALVRAADEAAEPIWSETVNARLLDASGHVLDQTARPRAMTLDEVGGPSRTATAVFEFAAAPLPLGELVVELNGKQALWQLLGEKSARPRPFWRRITRWAGTQR
jgi:hypothetical protein